MTGRDGLSARLELAAFATVGDPEFLSGLGLVFVRDLLREASARVAELEREADALAATIRHVLSHGHQGKQSERRLRAALAVAEQKEPQP